MNEHLETPPPSATPYDPAPPATRPRRRRVLVPALVAAVAVGALGTGAGFAVGSQHRATSPTPSASVQGTTSQTIPPGYYEQYGDQGYGYDQYGDQGFGGQGFGDQSTPSSPYGDGTDNGTGSTDTTSTASGDQLTGLVRIVSTQKYDQATAAGTGMVLTSDGEVVTNHHVVAGATTIKVTVMSTGTTYTARVVGTDATADVAVLQLSGASGLDTVTADNDGVTTGEAVTAVGDGNGTVDHLSAATGSVIATDQSITTQSEGSAEGENLTGLIQISSDVVGGYSGGATYDADGEVVGMTTAASSGTSDIVGYAVPISTVLTIADDLESGAKSADYTYGYPSFLGIALGSGTTVQGVYDGTPAADAGIGSGDSITAVAGIRTTTTTQLRAAIASHSPGDEVSITWTDSSGSSHTATVTLAQGPVE